MAQKRSKKRDAVLECLRATDTHPSAEWIYARLKPSIPELSIGTVYRNLAALRQQGRIASVGVVGGTERFDRCVEPHTHFVCARCGAVIDVAEIAPPPLRAVSCGAVQSCALTLIGTCNQCVQKTHNIT